MLMIMIDFITVKIALGGPAKSALVLLLRNGISRRRMVGGEVNMPLRFKRHTKHTELVLPTIALSF